MAHSSVPPDVRATLEAKCADCHSMYTWPYIYGRFAPVSWLMERDILEGRRQMNLSSRDLYSADQQLTFEAKIVREMKVGAMPLPQYRLVHWNARITDADVLAFVRWARETPDFAPCRLLEESDPVRGEAGLREAVYRLSCDGGKSGRPTAARCLWANLRDSGRLCLLSSSRSRTRSYGMKSTLEQWLTDPDTLVPGNNMDFHVAKPQERQRPDHVFETGVGQINCRLCLLVLIGTTILVRGNGHERSDQWLRMVPLICHPRRRLACDKLSEE